jgi:hypothetical protein
LFRVDLDIPELLEYFATTPALPLGVFAFGLALFLFAGTLTPFFRYSVHHGWS